MSGAGEGSARDRILGRIREADRGRDPVAHPGELPAGAGAPAPGPGGGARGRRARVEAFVRRLEASGGEVVLLAGEAEARAWLARFAGGFEDAAVSPSVEEALRPPLPAESPEDAGLGVSRALGAAAQTGSLILGSREGRRLQVLPPVHLVWIRADEIHATLAEALASVRDDLPAALALHSGPSKSADIGRIVVEGVHGPGRLVAAVLHGRGDGEGDDAGEEGEEAGRSGEGENGDGGEGGAGGCPGATQGP